MFIKMLKFDVKNGILRNYFLIIGTTVLALFFCIDFWYRLHWLTQNSVVESYYQATIGDYVAYVYAGMKQYVPGPDNLFSVPVVWILYMVTPAIAVLTYPLKDLQGFGQQVIYRSNIRLFWWISKCVWCILTTLAYHLIIAIVFISFCTATHASLSPEFNDRIIKTVYILKDDFFLTDNLVLTIEIMLMQILITVSLNLLQTSLSFFVNPVFSLIIIASIYIASAYYTSSLMVGNFAMILRTGEYIENGVSTQIGIFIFLGIMIFSILVGALKFESYDIISKQE